MVEPAKSALYVFRWEGGRVRIKDRYGFGITSFDLPQAKEAMKELEKAINAGEKEQKK